MANRLDIYKCDLCGHIIQIMHEGSGPLYCCGAPMKYIEAGTSDGAKEKHVPVIEKTDTGYKVSVGSVLHPMLDAHYIEWISLIADGVCYTKFLKPGDQPVAEFCIKADKVEAYEYCNLHSLWKA